MTDEPGYRDEAQLRDLYEDRELPVSMIAEKYDVTPKTINQWLDRHGIEKRSPGREIQIAKRREPLSFHTRPSDGYERIATKYAGEQSRVYHHRLLAVAEHGFDAIRGKDVHHESGVPWDNRPGNLELLGKDDHQNVHAEAEIVECRECGSEGPNEGRGFCRTCYDRLYSRHRHDHATHDPAECPWCGA